MARGFKSFSLVSALFLAPMLFTACESKQGARDGKNPVTDETPTTSNGLPTPTPGVPVYPVVYVHGLMDGKRDLIKTYFADIEAKSGVKIYRTEISPANSIAFRGKQLAKEIDRVLAESNADKVNIVAHSLGGLDSRYLISTLGYADRVASLSTIATPHQGTPLTRMSSVIGAENFANLINIVFGVSGKVLNSGSNIKDVDFQAAIDNLSEDFVQKTFNQQNPNQFGVFYQSWAGVSGPLSGHKTKLVLVLSNSFLKFSGPNDGLVLESSAKWGTYQGILRGDHLDTSGRDIHLLGGDGFDYVAFFQKLISGLAQRGL